MALTTTLTMALTARLLDIGQLWNASSTMSIIQLRPLDLGLADGRKNLETNLYQRHNPVCVRGCLSISSSIGNVLIEALGQKAVVSRQEHCITEIDNRRLLLLLIATVVNTISVYAATIAVYHSYK